MQVHYPASRRHSNIVVCLNPREILITNEDLKRQVMSPVSAFFSLCFRIGQAESRPTDRDSTSGGRSGRRRVDNRKAGRWIRRRGQRSRQTDRDWTAGRRSGR
ncbi:unnamed protein product [Arctogadus glacialis]